MEYLQSVKNRAKVKNVKNGVFVENGVLGVLAHFMVTAKQKLI